MDMSINKKGSVNELGAFEKLRILVCHHASSFRLNFLILNIIATLALGSRLRQGLARLRVKREA
jgi:hypothetical protein